MTHDARIIARTMAALGLLSAGGALLFSGPLLAVGALAGAATALVNWLALAWIVQRLVQARSRGRHGALLMLKLVGLGAACVLFLAGLRVDPLGFVLGLSSLVVAPLIAGSFLAAAPGRRTATEGKS